MKQKRLREIGKAQNRCTAAEVDELNKCLLTLISPVELGQWEISSWFLLGFLPLQKFMQRSSYRCKSTDEPSVVSHKTKISPNISNAFRHWPGLKHLSFLWVGLYAQGKDDVPTKRPPMVRSGVNTVTALVEQKKAQLVIIAHDVDPIEIVMFLPAVCRKMGVPYCIVKSKARLGTVVHRKTVFCLAITSVNPEDRSQLNRILEAVKTNFNDRFDEIHRHVGGGIMGSKSQARVTKLEKAKAKELAQKMG